MATTLNEEVREVQNPVLGSFLEWRFVVGYEETRGPGVGCPLPILFVVLPIVLHQETANHIASTRRSSGLRAFAAKFGAASANQSDLLLSINARARAMRDLSLESLRIAIGARLLTVDPEAAMALSLTKTTAKANIPESIATLAKGAERFGYWCGSLTLLEIQAIIRVRF